MNHSASMTTTRTRTKAAFPPGFRFHPTDVELVLYYLKRKVLGKRLLEAIAEVDLYKFAPWDLPAKSLLRSGDLEWYFFCPRGRHSGNHAKTKRSTDGGYWKTTGKDRSIIHNSLVVGMKKTLVYHTGRTGSGSRTNWVMHEYRLEDERLATAGIAQDLFVLCKLYEKSGPGPKNGEQHGAPFVEEEWEEDDNSEVSGLKSICLESTIDQPHVGCSGDTGALDVGSHSLDDLDRVLLDFLRDDDDVRPQSNPALENSCDELAISAQGPVQSMGSDHDGLEIFDGLENLSLPGNYDIEADLQKTLMGFDVEPSDDSLEPYIELGDFYTPFPGEESPMPTPDEFKCFEVYTSEISHNHCSSVLEDNGSVRC